MNQDLSEPQKYHELAYYTLARRDPSFIHQHIVDVYTAQRADESTKPFAITFALVGLYLYVEKNYSGKAVQKAHTELAKKRKRWPSFSLPEQRGEFTVSNVVNELPGEKRDEAIKKWCVSVWEAYEESHQEIVNLVKQELR